SEYELQDLFTMPYKELYYHVKNTNLEKGKTRGQVSYSVLKLRRLVAVWNRGKVWDVDCNIDYSYRDANNQFPKFDKQNPQIIPTIKTVQRLKAKALHNYIEAYNKNVDKILEEKSYVGQKPRYIRNLRDLRLCLMSDCKFGEAKASEITKKYGAIIAKKEVHDFSNEINEPEQGEEIVF
ncbi:MAG: hypothetical protein IJA69_06130, partial [Clostridia bacterium]|nr:hypothetical protein [Clostridia bacterium]